MQPPAPVLLSSTGVRLPPITPDDELWMLRAVEGEGPPEDWVAQALVNRWAYLYDRDGGKLFPTLASLVTAYAQPVNPLWMPGGAKHAAAKRAQPELAAELEARAVRRRDVHATRTTFSQRTRDAVARALRGPVTLPAGVVHYSVPQASWAPYRVVPGGPGRNELYTAPAARGALYAVLPPSSVPTWTPAQALASAGPHAGLGVALLGLLMAAAAAARRKRR